MARNLKFYINDSGAPCARGPLSEKVLMAFLETDVGADDHICHDLMEDIRAIEEGAADSREYPGKTHTVTINDQGIEIKASKASKASHEPSQNEQSAQQDNATEEAYSTGLKHFREILEDWEAFILDEADT